MDLKKIIRTERIITDLISSTVAGCLNEMLIYLEEKKVISGSSELLVELVEREENSSTVLCKGIAFPHIRSSHVDLPIIAIGHSLKGIDFKSVFGERVAWVFLILLPHEGNYLWVFSNLLETLSSCDVVNRLNDACSADQVITAFDIWTSSLKKPLLKGVSV